MSKRTVEELQEAKKELESTINLLVGEFEVGFGCRVVNVDVGNRIQYKPVCGGNSVEVRSTIITVEV